MKRQFMILLGMISLLPVLAGCVAVVAAGGAAGGVAYVRGDLKVVIEEPVARVNDAVAQTGRELELYELSADRDQLGGKFVYRNAQDEKITIQTTVETRETTALSIRIGLFGDEQKSQVILQEIRDNL